MKLYCITYDKTHPTLPGMHPYLNTSDTKRWRFEYSPMLDIIQNHINHLPPAEFIGIFSWKFTRKTTLTATQLHTWLGNVGELAPVHNCSPNLGQNIAGHGCFMDWSAAGHGETLRDLIKACCQHTGMQYHNNPAHIVYANQFIATRQIYTHYINTVIIPSLQLLEGPLWATANQPAKYTAGLQLDKLKQHTGLSFYNYIPFVLERLFMQYLHHHQIKTLNVL